MSVADKEQAALRSKLEALLRKPENQMCADCRARMPRWASTNLGIFLCTSCSGIHRGLGVHLSKVRSCALDKWTPELVNGMEVIGNARANAYWEAKPPGAYDRPAEGDMGRLNQFIRDKYERGIYSSDKGQSAPRVSTGSSTNASYAPVQQPPPVPPRKPLPRPPTELPSVPGQSRSQSLLDDLATGLTPSPLPGGASAPMMQQPDFFADFTGGGAQYNGGYQGGYQMGSVPLTQVGAGTLPFAPPPPPGRPLMRPR